MIHGPFSSQQQACRREAPPRRLPAAIPAVLAVLCLLTPVRSAAQPAVTGGMAPAPEPDHGRPVRVERSDDRGLVLAFAAADTAWRATVAPDGGAPLWELQLPGFSGHGAAARPVLPVWGAWIVVPPGMRPVVVPLTERWEAAPSRRLLVGLTPVALRDPESGEPDLGAELLLPGETPRRGRPLPATAQPAPSLARAGDAGPTGQAPLTVGEPIAWRGRRIASVTLAPLTADAEGLAARLLREGRWEIRFVAAAGGTGAGVAEARSGRGDDRFGFLFLNPEALRRWPAEASARPGPAPAPATATAAARRAVVPLAPEVQLLVPKTQLYRLTATRLRQLGWLPTGGVGEAQIRLYQRRYNAADPAHYLEIEVPIRLLGDGGDFSDGEALLFYALRARDDNAWTDLSSGVPIDVPGSGDPNEQNNGPSGASDPGLRTGNVYWLAFAEAPAGAPWARMAEAALPPSSGAPLARYRRVDYLEEDSGYQEATLDAAGDRNHYNRYSDTAATVSIPLWSPDPAGTDGRVRAGLIGWNITDVSRLVHGSLVCGLNTVDLGLFNLNNLNDVIADSGDTIGGGLLASPTATLRIDSLNNPATAINSYLDWVEIAYTALYRAVNDALTFPGDAVAGDRNLEVTGFGRADLGVIDLTDPHRPVWIVLGAGNVVDAGGSYTLSLQAAQPDGTPRRFMALADMAGAGVPEFTTFSSRRILAPADPTAASGSPGVIVVTHGAFRAALQPWLDYRSSAAGGGYALHVVEVQDVYDWFSGGLKDPWAIRRFCTYARDHWGSWGLVLVGDANENARALNVVDGVYDWLPTHLHAQHVLDPPEVLAADKWYATPGVDAFYPTGTRVPAEMIVGRFPCNSDAELATMIAKTLQAEADQAGQAWRRRAMFVADDDFSYGYGETAFSTLIRDTQEQRFRVSEDSLAARWDRFADGAQTPSRFFLSTYLDPLYPPGDLTRNLALAKENTKSAAVPYLLADLSQGALLVDFQGHAAAKLLCHEYLFEDERATPSPFVRQDVISLTNAARPWVFLGFGCHISDWLQNTADHSAPELSSLAEKVLTQPGGGACASYASSGYEFLGSNADFAELQLSHWLFTPPRPIGRTRTGWRLGDLLLAGEAAVLARYTSPYDTEYRALAAQYCLLGDPLLTLDCGPPSIAAVFTDAGDTPVTDGLEVAALDSTNVRRIRLTAVDEAGVDRVVVLDSAGHDLSSAVTELPPPDPATNQRALYDIALPVRPFDHSVTLHVYDTSDRLPTDNHATLTVRLPLTGSIFLAGSPDPLEPGAVRFAAGVPLDFTAVVATPAYVTAAAALALTGDGLTLDNVHLARRDAHTLDLAFTATAPDAAASLRAVTLLVSDYPTTFVLQQGEAPLARYSLDDVLAFPNPSPGPVRILFRTTAPASPGRIVIYTVGGRRVAVVPFGADRMDAGQGLLTWSGRDDEGDALANGVYLYRVELDAPGGGLRSGMQRLVMMR